MISRERDMISREQYAPGAAFGAEVRKGAEEWTLVLVRDLRHAPESVWEALTDPEHLREWAPFDSDRNLGTVGTAKLSAVGAPTPQVSETRVKRAVTGCQMLATTLTSHLKAADPGANAEVTVVRRSPTA